MNSQDILILLVCSLLVLFSFKSTSGVEVTPFGSISVESGDVAVCGYDGGLLVASRDGLGWWVRDKDVWVQKKKSLRNQALSQHVKHVSVGKYNGTDVILTLSNDGTLTAYSSSLTRRWETLLGEDLPEEAFLAEYATSVWDVGVRKGDKGSVMVVARFEVPQGLQTTEVQRQARARKRSFKVKDAELIDGHHKEQSDRNKKVRKGRAYSVPVGVTGVWLVEAEVGEVRWSSHGQGQRRMVDAAEVASASGLDQETFKAHALSAMGPVKERSWLDFQWDVMEHGLPHSWHMPGDAKVSLHHFERGRMGKRKRASEAFNVAVVRHIHGIDVLHLYSGRTLCRIATEDGLYVNHNNIAHVYRVHTPLILDLENVEVRSSAAKQSGAQSHSACEMTVTSGMPPMHVLRREDLCSGKEDLKISSLPPVLPGPAVLTSDGVLHLHSKTHQTPSSWSNAPVNLPSLTAFSSGHKHYYLAVGDLYASVISQESGKVVTSFVVESGTFSVPRFELLNNDSVFVMPSQSAVYVYHFADNRPSYFLGYVLLAVIGSIAIAGWSLTAKKT